MKTKSLILAALVLAVSPSLALASGPAAAPSKTQTTGTRNANQYHDRTPQIHDRTPVLSH